MKNPRTVIGALALSASALVGIAQWEDYRGEAYTPVKGDVPTIGFGTTSGVKRGDTITPPRALVRLLADADQYASAVKRCAPVPMYQHEFDGTVSFVYNVGPTAFCNSTMAKKFRSGDYTGACNELPKWVYVKGRRVQGLVNRREAERKLCLGILMR
jgi:lysozyme